MSYTLTQSIRDQFVRSLLMFREAVENFPAEEWTKGEMDYLRPASAAYHVVETIAFYAGDVPVDQFTWGAHFGCDCEDAAFSARNGVNALYMRGGCF